MFASLSKKPNLSKIRVKLSSEFDEELENTDLSLKTGKMPGSVNELESQTTYLTHEQLNTPPISPDLHLICEYVSSSFQEVISSNLSRAYIQYINRQKSAKSKKAHLEYLDIIKLEPHVFTPNIDRLRVNISQLGRSRHGSEWLLFSLIMIVRSELLQIIRNQCSISPKEMFATYLAHIQTFSRHAKDAGNISPLIQASLNRLPVTFLLSINDHIYSAYILFTLYDELAKTLNSVFYGISLHPQAFYSAKERYRSVLCDNYPAELENTASNRFQSRDRINKICIPSFVSLETLFESLLPSIWSEVELAQTSFSFQISSILPSTSLSNSFNPLQICGYGQLALVCSSLVSLRRGVGLWSSSAKNIVELQGLSDALKPEQVASKRFKTDIPSTTTSMTMSDSEGEIYDTRGREEHQQKKHIFYANRDLWERTSMLLDSITRLPFFALYPTYPQSELQEVEKTAKRSQESEFLLNLAPISFSYSIFDAMTYENEDEKCISISPFSSLFSLSGGIVSRVLAMCERIYDYSSVLSVFKSSASVQYSRFGEDILRLCSLLPTLSSNELGLPSLVGISTSFKSKSKSHLLPLVMFEDKNENMLVDMSDFLDVTRDKYNTNSSTERKGKGTLLSCNIPLFVKLVSEALDIEYIISGGGSSTSINDQRAMYIYQRDFYLSNYLQNRNSTTYNISQFVPAAIAFHSEWISSATSKISPPSLRLLQALPSLSLLSGCLFSSSFTSSLLTVADNCLLSSHLPMVLSMGLSPTLLMRDWNSLRLIYSLLQRTNAVPILAYLFENFARHTISGIFTFALMKPEARTKHLYHCNIAQKQRKSQAQGIISRALDLDIGCGIDDNRSVDMSALSSIPECFSLSSSVPVDPLLFPDSKENQNVHAMLPSFLSSPSFSSSTSLSVPEVLSRLSSLDANDTLDLSSFTLPLAASFQLGRDSPARATTLTVSAVHFAVEGVLSLVALVDSFLVKSFFNDPTLSKKLSRTLVTAMDAGKQFFARSLAIYFDHVIRGKTNFALEVITRSEPVKNELSSTLTSPLSVTPPPPSTLSSRLFLLTRLSELVQLISTRTFFYEEYVDLLSIRLLSSASAMRYVKTPQQISTITDASVETFSEIEFELLALGLLKECADTKFIEQCVAMIYDASQAFYSYSFSRKWIERGQAIRQKHQLQWQHDNTKIDTEMLPSSQIVSSYSMSSFESLLKQSRVTVLSGSLWPSMVETAILPPEMATFAEVFTGYYHSQSKIPLRSRGDAQSRTCIIPQTGDVYPSTNDTSSARDIGQIHTLCHVLSPSSVRGLEATVEKRRYHHFAWDLTNSTAVVRMRLPSPEKDDTQPSTHFQLDLTRLSPFLIAMKASFVDFIVSAPMAVIIRLFPTKAKARNDSADPFQRSLDTTEIIELTGMSQRIVLSALTSLSCASEKYIVAGLSARVLLKHPPSYTVSLTDRFTLNPDIAKHVKTSPMKIRAVIAPSMSTTLRIGSQRDSVEDSTVLPSQDRQGFTALLPAEVLSLQTKQTHDTQDHLELPKLLTQTQKQEQNFSFVQPISSSRNSEKTVEENDSVSFFSSDSNSNSNILTDTIVENDFSLYIRTQPKVVIEAYIMHFAKRNKQGFSLKEVTDHIARKLHCQVIPSQLKPFLERLCDNEYLEKEDIGNDDGVVFRYF